MKFISERISISESAETSSIIISPDFSIPGQRLLLAWVVFWTIGGLVIVAQIFGDYNNEEKMFLLAWSVFWLYFEYVGIYAWLWKKHGLEKIVLKKESILYYRSINAKGKPQVLDKRNISEIKKTDFSEDSILYNLSNSYWNKGSESCEIRHNGKSLRFGLKLNKQEAEGLVNYLGKKLRY